MSALAGPTRRDPAAMVARKPDHQGDHKVTVKTIAQGRPDVPVNLWRLRSCAFFAHDATGAVGTRLSLRPLFGHEFSKLGQGMSRGRCCMSDVIASVSEAIQHFLPALDCFVASAPRNDALGFVHRSKGFALPLLTGNGLSRAFSVKVQPARKRLGKRCVARLSEASLREEICEN
jgi:hypothetical protein